MSIKILDSDTAGKIAAGEVITGPGAVVKELLENSIDARSSMINVNIEDGGKKSITVSDNGDGIPMDDVELAFKRHATSKISKMDDLESIRTLGFRGEALASIAAISKVQLKTRYYKEESGSETRMVPGKINIKHKNFGKGTTIIIEDLFYNTPARLKHLKKSVDLNKEIINIVENIGISRPEISFSVTIDGKVILKTPGDDNLFNCIYTVYGKNFVENLIEIDYENAPMRISGYIGQPSFSKSTRLFQYITINHRFIEDSSISKAIEEAYENTIMINKHPVFVINIQLPPHMLDVNIHPSKTKIKILNESLVFLLLKDGIRKKIRETGSVPQIQKETFKALVQEDNDHQLQERIILNDKVEESSQVFTYENPIIKSPLIEYKNDNETTFKRDTEINDIKRSVEIINENKIGNLFKEVKLIGQIFNTYILFQNDEFVLMIDQHAAHERILYEYILSTVEKGDKVSQNIFPINMRFSPKEYEILVGRKKVFSKLGFEYDEFGNNIICVRSVPIFMNLAQEPKLLNEILEEIQDKTDIGLSSRLEDKIILSACKRAIKANKVLNSKEIDYLVEQLSMCKYPYTCPHGRPTLLKMTKYEFEKQFKRIQS